MRMLTVVMLLALAAGCSEKLETGYAPRKLGATEAQRRGYYAQPYTPEARAAETDKQTDLKDRRPAPGM